MKSIQVCGLLLSALLSGAAAQPQEVAPAPGKALLRLKSNSRGIFNPNSNTYAMFDNDRCVGDPKTSALASVWFEVGWGKKIQPAQIPAGQPLFIRAISSTSAKGSRYVELTPCVNMVTFTPVPGHTYDVNQAAEGGRCATTITDSATDQPPETFAQVPLRWSCKP